MVSSERGTTLTEVLVVMAISAIIVPSLYLSIVAGFRSERSQDAALVAEENLGRVADRLTNDVREFWPSDARTLAPADELALASVADNGDEQAITWSVDGDSLIRLETVGESGTTVSRVEMITDLAMEGSVFRYWDDAGTEITDGQRIANCATRLTINLRTDDGETVAETTFDVAHRTRDPEVEPC